MVLRLGGQPAHLNNLPWVPAGTLQHLITKLREVQVAQLEMAGGGSNSCLAFRSGSGGTFSTCAGFQNSRASAPKLKASRDAANRAMPGVCEIRWKKR